MAYWSVFELVEDNVDKALYKSRKMMYIQYIYKYIYKNIWKVRRVCGTAAAHNSRTAYVALRRSRQ